MDNAIPAVEMALDTARLLLREQAIRTGMASAPIRHSVHQVPLVRDLGSKMDLIPGRANQTAKGWTRKRLRSHFSSSTSRKTPNPNSRMRTHAPPATAAVPNSACMAGR